MDQIYATDMNCATVNSIQFRDAQADWIVPMGRSRREHSLLRSFKLGWLYLALLIVVVVEADVKYEDDPDVAEAVQPLEARRVDFIDEGHAGACPLDKA